MEIVYTLGSRNLEGEVPAPGTKGGVEGGCFVFVRHLWACDSTAWLLGEWGIGNSLVLLPRLAPQGEPRHVRCDRKRSALLYPSSIA